MNESPLRWLTEERDACGVGFLADRLGRATNLLIQQTLKALTCMEHRGGCGSDSDSGDGAGILTAIPWNLFREWAAIDKIDLPAPERTAVGMFFLPRDESQRARVCARIDESVEQSDFNKIGWRDVPTRPDVLGAVAKANQPFIAQLVLSHPDLTGDRLERSLYVLRRQLTKQVASQFGPEAFYAASLSSRTIVYKGMVRSAVLGQFYLDLQNPLFISPFATFHRRFSTNTYPRWPLAQPMRYLAHNGEINTFLGNANWLAARESSLSAPQLEGIVEEIKPIVAEGSSDSGALDNALELMVRAGHPTTQAMMVLVPEAYCNQPELNGHPEIADFYEFFGGIQEPWDGPALIVFSDGTTVGAALDRNGLRPARYVITCDGLILVGSEAGVVEIAEDSIVEKGRLGPGQMLAVDLSSNQVLKNWDIKQQVAAQHPYGQWLQEYRVELQSAGFAPAAELSERELVQMQTAFGFSLEDVEMIVEAMAAKGKEPIFCMGDDAPLAILSQRPHPLYDYFKQRFAQVTNPPIDPLRESLVMSLDVYLGRKGNLLDPQPQAARLLHLKSPVINEAELQSLSSRGFATAKLPMVFAIADGPTGLERAVKSLCERAEAAVRAGVEILHLSDRDLDAEHAFIPPLLAVGAIHHHLIRAGLRLQASIVVETAQCWSTHHYACLIGYGASAVCPYLAFETVRQWWGKTKTQTQMSEGKLEPQTLEEVQLQYRAAVDLGLLKILSKMGISLLTSYQGAQIFEAIGLDRKLVDLAFCGTVSRVGGLTLQDLAQEVIDFHQRAFPELRGSKLENYGFIQSRPRGEHHINSPLMAKKLHKALQSGEPDLYEIYRASIAERPPTALRDLLEFDSDRESISIDEVEPVEEIFKRFATGGMSLGALSREAHETLAIAMNRIGGKSNSGEGGEDPSRFIAITDVSADGRSTGFPHLKGLQSGDSVSSAIKQVASGRFGVTPEYLLSARQIEIKVAQGAKPGEGGQLPGHKVSPYIAGLRRSKPGVPLISPPPHHDIYSIEDLAQLIFDLHQINPTAKVSVKLVAEIGIGTVAAGVAKANADIIQISGHDGGTGASPLSSIKHAGGPWELGITEVHRALMDNGLRDRSILRVDGGIRSGWEVVVAAMLGAEEFGFGTVAMIATGCIMARVCHTNNCPVGVTTQQERLRKRFSGVPGDVVTFFTFVAEEVRQILARLGYRSLKQVIGRADLLSARQQVRLSKVNALDLGCLLNLPDTRDDRSWLDREDVHSNGAVLDDELLENPELKVAIERVGTARIYSPIANTDRTVGARIAGQIAKRYGNDNFAAKGGRIHLHFSGSAGQSFGAFTLPGMSLTLEGEANDYVGKGMNGGEIAIRPPVSAHRPPEGNVIIGNTCLYGATGGILLASGRAGERFAVRNSQGTAAIEGAGDHCCEYMTGGRVVVLGKVGRNVGAGMTGGLAYFLDEEGNFPAKVNGEIVRIQRVQTPAAEAELRDLIALHRDRTGSPKAARILENWDEYLPQFWQVIPPSEDNTELTHLPAVAETAAVPQA
ncbi:glutamate synthase large subunit [Synechococcus sp. PCC 7336]|uniref:glutamate synthase large subunit n=1 Tax=Synechococcus sp. PCC 7336 TaxID=195250 RepID=UPI0003457891|nr:glutamate synthase large subunit [Synechococcus sp. PCC 7336]